MRSQYTKIDLKYRQFLLRIQKRSIFLDRIFCLNLIAERRIRPRDDRGNHFLFRQLRQRSKQNSPRYR